MGTKHTNITHMKLGQDLISLGLKVQKHEVSLDYVLNNINVSALEEINNSTDWEKDVTTVGKISALMEIQSITQSDMARGLKVSRQYVSDLLSSKKQLNNKTISKIAEILGVKPSAITKA